MTEADARRLAEQARGAHEVHPDAALTRCERCYIELAAGDPEREVRVRDLLAWVARFEEGASFVALALDDRNGTVVRVEKSRSS